MKAFFSYSPLWQQSGLTLIRVVTGFLMAWHGWEVFDANVMKGYAVWDSFKGFSSPSTMVYIGKATELVAGLLLIAGLFTRLACLLIIGTMLYILFFIGKGLLLSDDQHSFLFVLLGFVFFFTGPGKYSMDYWLFKNKR